VDRKLNALREFRKTFQEVGDRMLGIEVYVTKNRLEGFFF